MHSLPRIPVLNENNANSYSDFFVQRIICVARNYVAHAMEMGHQVNPTAPREAPFYFFKPLTALNTSGEFSLPRFSNNVQHELELVIGLGHGGNNLTPERAKACVSTFALGLDMTARDTQKQAKELGRPWDLAKGFDGSAIVSTMVNANFSQLAEFGDMTLAVNNKVVQRGHWQQMTWPIPELLSAISEQIQLVPGDIIYTGTPEGVGPVFAGDVLCASMKGFPHTLNSLVKSI